MNRGSDSILSVYSDARAEYTKQLCVFLVPAYFQFYIELLDKAKTDMISEPKRALWQFQNYLNEIHDWNMEKVHNEIHRIQTNSGCDYLDDLLTAVFIAHTKVLTAIRLSSNNKKIKIDIPKVEHFLFKALCETSKLLWSSTYLFREGISGIEKQQNYRNIEQLLNEGILQAVRSLVPVKSILKDFVNSDAPNDDMTNDDESDDSDNEDTTIKNEKEETDKSTLINESINQLTSTNITPPVVELPVTTISQQETPVQQEITENISTELQTNNTHVSHVSEVPQTIVIEDKPTVRFGEFDAVFDSDNPLDSDMIFEPKDEEDDVPVLEVLDEVGVPLSEGLDFDDLDNTNGNNTNEIGSDEYEELN